MSENYIFYNNYLTKILERWTHETERSIWSGHYESEKDKINLCFDIANRKAREVYNINSYMVKEPEAPILVTPKESPLKKTSYFESMKPLVIPEEVKKPIVYEKKLSELSLPSHLHNLLHKANIRLVSELSLMTQNQLENIFSYNETYILELIFELNKLSIKHKFSLNKYIQEEIKDFSTRLKNIKPSPIPVVPESKPVEPVKKVETKETTPITDFEFSPRAHSRLRFAEINTLDDLLSKSTVDLLKIPSFGKTHLKTIVEELNANSIKHSFKLTEIE